MFGAFGWRGRLLEEPADRLAARARVVARLEDVEFVALDEVLPGEQGRGDAALLDQTPQALRVNAKLAGGLNQIQVVVERGVGHCRSSTGELLFRVIGLPA